MSGKVDNVIQCHIGVSLMYLACELSNVLKRLMLCLGTFETGVLGTVQEIVNCILFYRTGLSTFILNARNIKLEVPMYWCFRIDHIIHEVVLLIHA